MLGRLLTLGGALAAGYAATRALVDRATPPPLPGPARKGAEAAQSRLQGVRDIAYQALSEASRAIEESRQELEAEYLRRAGRSGERPPRSRR